MTKENYMTIYDKDPDEIQLTNEDVREWLDAIVDPLITASKNKYNLCYGVLNLDRGEYENQIRPCLSHEKPELHIFEGIDKLAKAIGRNLNINPDRGTEYPVEYWFDYKGCKVFQLEKEGYEVDV